MEILHAIVLGIVQGLSEFLPISSSGHLELTRWLFGWDALDGIWRPPSMLRSISARFSARRASPTRCHQVPGCRVRLYGRPSRPTGGLPVSSRVQSRPV